MSSQRIDLREADQHTFHRLPREVAAGLVEAGIAAVAPTFVADEYRVSSVRKVGVVRIAGYDVWIRPKTPVRRLFAMLGYARAGSAIWEDEDFGFAADEDLVPALAHAFERQAARALAGGPLRGYVTREDALPLVRGRWRIGDQFTRRGGQPLPVEVSFDDYVENIAENQLVLTAAARLLRLPGVPDDVVLRLRRVVRVLDGVTVIPVGAPVPVVQTDRRNARYSAVLPLASLVLSGASIEQRAGSHIGAGFLVDMWSVFEDFVTASLRRPSGRTGRAGGAVLVDARCGGDGEDRAGPRVGRRRGRAGVHRREVQGREARAVPERGSVPDGGVLPAVRVGEGHLVYAAGEDEPRVVIVIDGPEVRQHALDLDRSVNHIVVQLASLLETRIAARSSA